MERMKPLQDRKDSFEQFWDCYQKKIDRPKCERKWNHLKASEKELIMDTIMDYVESTPDKQFRKNPATYLNNESWLNEIIVKSNGQTEFTYEEVVRIHWDRKDKRAQENFEAINPGEKGTKWKLK